MMRDINEQMLHMKVLDPDVSILFSEYTGKWYVSIGVHIGGDGMLEGFVEHAETPGAAVGAAFVRMTELPFDKILVTERKEENYKRRHWRWNGAAFAEEPVPLHIREHNEQLDAEARAKNEKVA